MSDDTVIGHGRGVQGSSGPAFVGLVDPPDAVMAALRSRIERCERLVFELAGAIVRKGSEQDGNWGYPFSYDEIQRIRRALATPADLERLHIVSEPHGLPRDKP